MTGATDITVETLCQDIVQAARRRRLTEKIDLVLEAGTALMEGRLDSELRNRLKYGVFSVTPEEEIDAGLVHAQYRLVQCRMGEMSEYQAIEDAQHLARRALNSQG